MHDAGGWYVETFGRDDEGNNTHARRHWDGFDKNDQRLHPAMYLLPLAYRTLDLEEAERQKRTMKERVEANIYKAFSWYRKTGSMNASFFFSVEL
ncbi:hypothetical protein M569_01196 [Genlisea aurea]|uniref:Uncharacterized protein n=1 Tax=Genlisea aurea TaxID=192259 RepID=S8D7U6_9LAMI|nr:hypothetical protein M569_01196 [Genlisea aurea]